MKRIVIAAATLALLVALAATGLAGDCSCKEAKAEGGWCKACSAGYFGDMVLTSQKLHEALHGKKIPKEKLANIPCGGCKTAVKTSGSCDGCNVSFADGHVYRSKYAAALARGHRMEWEKKKEYKNAYDKAEKTKKVAKEEYGCKGCAAAMNSGGWCPDCNVGFLGSYAYKDKVHHLEAKKALTMIQRADAISKKCETCAVAMITDSGCKSCELTFKNGKKVRL